jgi:hypothetical protein
MATKDFSNINTGRVYNQIAEATTEKRKYTKKLPADEQEATERAETLRTQGREGCKLPRINLAFSPSNYEYCKIMAGVTGMSMTAFINSVLNQHREANQDLYKKAKAIKDSL